MNDIILYCHCSPVSGHLTFDLILPQTDRYFRFDTTGFVELEVRLGDKIDVIYPKVDFYWETKNSNIPLFLNLYHVDYRKDFDY